ncbi:phosphotransferase [Roseimaritima ulvae]|uniref:Phosphotransferase enzyme family protein n=1 Tax=Roseimaritima ulvae TaxID=980254 RepID=A0A5B9QN01_9BACT|nr:phosphotransferase [Roseimaritima ulvae]QEG39252.1 Phosphotransferase enzyme family protein [Roseimaritima ulvae]
MVDTLSDIVRRMTGAQSVQLGKPIQSLWSGYGVIQRAVLQGPRDGGSDEPTAVVIKHIDVSQARSNRRGWGGDASHLRKVRSYEVEQTFYERYSGQCDPSCQVPGLIAAHEKANESGWVIVLTDLDAQGFDRRKNDLDQRGLRACLTWLANFHATFLGSSASGLWPMGTYWHLDTRPDELAALPSGPLKRSAAEIDRRLNAATFQTLVHGDAKVANFCFSDRDRDRVAAVDFQYVGRGCGMKDVAYLISSCLTADEAASQEEALLNIYFEALRDAIAVRPIEIDVAELEREWRALYPFAWADFCRFLAGWSPDHWKLNAYSDRITQSVLKHLGHS